MITAQCLGFLNTPPLWENKQFDIQQFEFPQLALQQFLPKPIPQNIRLGHQMEHVFQQLIEYSGAYDIVLSNLQIGNRERTVGEIDFILKDKALDQLIHVELTYKFYLIDPEIPEPIHQIIGPNRRDAFFAKMEKIKQVQFPLLHSAAGVKALADQQLDHLTIEHQCCFKAQLFQPFGSSTIDIGSLNTGCLAGYWLRLDDFKKPEFSTAQFYIPTKYEWVIEPHNKVLWQSHADIMEVIRPSLLDKKAPMLWLKNLAGEFVKIFVVWW